MVFMLMSVSFAAKAEVKEGAFSVTPFAGGYMFEGNEYLKTSYAVGLRAGYNLTENIGVEGYFNYIPTQVKDFDDADVKLYGYGAEVLWHFIPEGSLVPFVAIGMGGIQYTASDDSSMNKFSVDYGAGLKYFVTDDIALRADVRHVIPLNDRYNDLLFTVGVTFSFGGEQKHVAKYEEPVSPVVQVKPEEPATPPAPPAKVEEPAPPVKETPPAVEAPAPQVEQPVQPVAPPEPVVEPAAPVVTKEIEQTTPEEDVKIFVNKWLASWQNGDMETYRSCYAPDFRSKGMDLNAWINYKNHVRQRSKNISIKIEDLNISADEKTASATAVFNQYYSSSILKDSVRKTLKLKKINENWKISRETIEPLN